MTWKTFYDKVWGDKFGATAGRPNPHRGTDLQKPRFTKVPSYVSGTVVDVVQNSVVGWYVVISIGGGRYIGYCHLRAGTMPKIGAKIKAGDIIGEVAGTGDFTGSAWTGPHIHITETSTPRPSYGPWFDPQPRINENTSTIEREEDEEMKPKLHYYKEHPDGSVLIATHPQLGEYGFQEYRGNSAMEAIERLWGDGVSSANKWNGSLSEYNEFKKQAEAAARIWRVGAASINGGTFAFSGTAVSQ